MSDPQLGVWAPRRLGPASAASRPFQCPAPQPSLAQALSLSLPLLPTLLLPQARLWRCAWAEALSPSLLPPSSCPRPSPGVGPPMQQPEPRPPPRRRLDFSSPPSTLRTRGRSIGGTTSSSDSPSGCGPLSCSARLFVAPPRETHRRPRSSHLRGLLQTPAAGSTSTGWSTKQRRWAFWTLLKPTASATPAAVAPEATTTTAVEVVARSREPSRGQPARSWMLPPPPPRPPLAPKQPPPPPPPPLLWRSGGAEWPRDEAPQAWRRGSRTAAAAGGTGDAYSRKMRGSGPRRGEAAPDGSPWPDGTPSEPLSSEARANTSRRRQHWPGRGVYFMRVFIPCARDVAACPAAARVRGRLRARLERRWSLMRAAAVAWAVVNVSLFSAVVSACGSAFSVAVGAVPVAVVSVGVLAAAAALGAAVRAAWAECGARRARSQRARLARQARDRAAQGASEALEGRAIGGRGARPSAAAIYRLRANATPAECTRPGPACRSRHPRPRSGVAPRGPSGAENHPANGVSDGSLRLMAERAQGSGLTARAPLEQCARAQFFQVVASAQPVDVSGGGSGGGIVRYAAIAVGYESGVFAYKVTYDEAGHVEMPLPIELHTTDFPGPYFSTFDTLAEAREWLRRPDVVLTAAHLRAQWLARPAVQPPLPDVRGGGGGKKKQRLSPSAIAADAIRASFVDRHVACRWTSRGSTRYFVGIVESAADAALTGSPWSVHFPEDDTHYDWSWDQLEEGLSLHTVLTGVWPEEPGQSGGRATSCCSMGRNTTTDATLLAQFASLRLKVKRSPGDGNCFFHSVRPWLSEDSDACSRVAMASFLCNHPEGRRLCNAYCRIFGAPSLTAALVSIGTDKSAVGSLALRAAAVLANRPLVLLNGIPGSATADVGWYDNDAHAADSVAGRNLLFVPLTFADLGERLALLPPDAPPPFFVVWDGVGHFDRLEPLPVPAPGRAPARAGAAPPAEPASPPVVATEASPPSLPRSARRSLPPNDEERHPAFRGLSVPTEWPAPCPVAAGRGTAGTGGCGIATCKGLLTSGQHWAAHDQAHARRHAVYLERVARLDATAERMAVDGDSGDEAPRDSSPLPHNASFDTACFDDLSNVDVEDLLRPGTRTVMFLPRGFRTAARAAFSKMLCAFNQAASPAAQTYAGKALASFAVLGLRVRRADMAGEEQDASPLSSPRRRRDCWLAHQLRLLATGKFADAVHCLLRQRSSEQQRGAPDAAPSGGSQSVPPHGSGLASARAPAAELPAAAALGPGWVAGPVMEGLLDEEEAEVQFFSSQQPPPPPPVPLAPLAPTPPLGEPAEPRKLTPGVIRRACRFISLGELGKGAAALVQSVAATFCHATFCIIDALHPPAPVDMPIPAHILSANPAPVQVSRDTLVAVLGRLRKGVSAGVSGLTNDHLRCLFPTETDGDVKALDPLLTFVNRALAGDVDGATVEWLCASKLVVLLKPDGAGGFKKRPNGMFDLRPVAIPETLYRLIALCALAESVTTVKAALISVQQLCVGVPSACEGIAAAVRLYLAELEQPEADVGDAIERAQERLMRAVISTDGTNAFNTVSRAAVMEAVLKRVPGLLPFVRLSYSGVSRLMFVNDQYSGKPGEELWRNFQSQTGVRQGDPLGPALFALAVIEVLEKVQAQHPDADICAFADDGIGCLQARGRAALAAKARAVYLSFETEFAKVAVYLNTKTKLLCFGDAALGTEAGMTGVDGMSVLGVPTSGSVRMLVNLALKRLAEALEQLDVLPQLPFSEAMLLLRFCIGVRANYLMGQLPSEAQAQVAAVWDPAVERCLTRMFRGQSPPPRVFLFGEGGLGVACQAQQGDLMRVCGWSRASAVVDEYLPKQRRLALVTEVSQHPLHVEVRAAYAALPAVARSADAVYDPLSPPLSAAAAAAAAAAATAAALAPRVAERATAGATSGSGDVAARRHRNPPEGLEGRLEAAPPVVESNVEKSSRTRTSRVEPHEGLEGHLPVQVPIGGALAAAAPPRSPPRKSSSATPPSNPLKAAVDALCSAVYKVQRAELFASLSDTAKLLLELASAPGARAWADARPRFNYHKLSDAHARVAYSLWLGAPIAELAGSVDPTGRALLRAAPPARRHTALLKAYLDASLLTGGQVYKEVTGLFCGWDESRVDRRLQLSARGEQRRMDGVVVQEMVGTLFDPTLVDGALPTDVAAQLTNASVPRAVVAAERQKTDYYGPDMPAGFAFFPVGHDSLGGSGKGALAFQQWLAKGAAQHSNGGAPPSARLIALKGLDLRQRISLAIMRATAGSVMRQFAGSPHAALTPAHRYRGHSDSAPPRFEDGSAV